MSGVQTPGRVLFVGLSSWPKYNQVPILSSKKLGRLHESTAFICYYNLIDYILSFLGQCYRTLDKSENIKEPAGGIEFW